MKSDYFDWLVWVVHGTGTVVLNWQTQLRYLRIMKERSDVIHVDDHTLQEERQRQLELFSLTFQLFNILRRDYAVRGSRQPTVALSTDAVWRCKIRREWRVNTLEKWEGGRRSKCCVFDKMWIRTCARICTYTLQRNHAILPGAKWGPGGTESLLGASDPLRMHLCK